jgi:hypothetical protein
MLLQTPDQNRKKSRVDFRIDEFRKLIKQKGMRLDWEQTIECPCTNISTTDFKFDLKDVTDINANTAGNNTSCPICNGKGLVRHSKQEIQAIVTNSESEDSVGKYGLLKQGSIKITLEPEHLPSYGDRFTMKDSVIVWRETVTMPDSYILELSYPVVERTLSLSPGQTSVGVLFMQQTDLNGLGIESTDLPIHSIDVDGRINFLETNSRPTPGTKLSIAYYTNPVYNVIEHPHTFRDTYILNNSSEVFSTMPIQVIAKQEVVR